jgi:hypothetical protein
MPSMPTSNVNTRTTRRFGEKNLVESIKDSYEKNFRKKCDTTVRIHQLARLLGKHTDKMTGFSFIGYGKITRNRYFLVTGHRVDSIPHCRAWICVDARLKAGKTNTGSPLLC